MSIAEELQKLQALHAGGALTEAEYAKAKEAVLNGAPAPLTAPPAAAGDVTAQGTNWLRGLTRSSHDAWLGGVCGGLGRHTSLPSWSWRLLFLFFLLTFGVGIIPYIVMWICIPPDPLGE